MNRSKPTFDDLFGEQTRIPGEKKYIEGPGSFRDLRGKPDISGNTIVFPWRGANSIALAGFTFFWNLFSWLFVWPFIFPSKLTVNGVQYTNSWKALYDNPGLLVFFLFAAVGLALIYHTVAVFRDETKFTFEYPFVHVSRSPFPWKETKCSIRSDAIRQVFVEEFWVRSENEAPFSFFRVKAMMDYGPDLVIETGFLKYSDARILEQWLETRLRIEDQPVPDEA